jgi:pyruvate formate lyase activating enzyme
MCYVKGAGSWGGLKINTIKEYMKNVEYPGIKIAGLQKVSMVDYPGLIAATIFTQGCNFRCGFCHNRDLMASGIDFGFSQQDLFEYLESRKNLIDGVCITGGEPTLWEDLPDLMKRIKEKGFKVKLDTNGSNPALLAKLLQESLVDYVAMDVKTSLSKYKLFKAPDDIEYLLAESINAMVSSVIPYEFRTTCVPGVVTEEDIYAIGTAIKGAKQHYLQQFRPHDNVLDEQFKHVKPYTRKTLDGFKKILEAFVDKVAVRGA